MAITELNPHLIQIWLGQLNIISDILEIYAIQEAILVGALILFPILAILVALLSLTGLIRLAPAHFVFGAVLAFIAGFSLMSAKSNNGLAQENLRAARLELNTRIKH